MLIIPAIDLRQGKCVRLQQGSPDRETVYSDDPVKMAKHWESEGARYLHVVDLDGAFAGRPAQLDIVSEIIAAVNIPVEVGGGLRAAEDVQKAINIGAARVVLGTSAVEEKELLPTLLRRFGNRIAVGIDARNGRVTIRGWTATSDIEAVDLAREMAGLGTQTLIYTDVATDGMLAGPNIDGVARLLESVSCRVIASGGISQLADLARLRDLGRPNLHGVVIGKALYDGRLSLRAALRQAAAAE